MADYTDTVHDFLLALVDENDPVTDDAQVIKQSWSRPIASWRRDVVASRAFNHDW